MWYLVPGARPSAFKRPESETERLILEGESGAYVGRRVSSRVSSIWMALTMADSFFSLWKIFDRSCSMISCLGKQIKSQVLMVTSLNSNDFGEKGPGTSETHLI